MDDVYPGWDGLRDAAVLLCRWLFRPLAAGRPAGYYRYDWSAGRFGAWQPVEPGGVLVLEGVGSGSARLAARLSLLVWVEAPPEIRRQRALERDGETFAAHWDRWAAQEERYLAQEAPQLRADLTVPT